jgi:hypothetical protein
MKIFNLFSIINLFVSVSSDFMFDYDKKPEPYLNNTELTLNATTSYLYTYSQSGHHFYGPAYDGSYIDTYGCCSGQSGSCRNNPSCQCKVSVGPLPQGTYTLGNMYTFKGMPYCYDLYPSSSNNMCGRAGFLIHGGSCSGNPSEGCIVIEDQNIRYKIKSGATLKVIS